MLTLKSGELHLWLLPDDAPTLDEARVTQMLEALPKGEQARHAQFVVRRPKREYILTRTLVRRVLSRYTHVLPSAWRFTANEFGRPAIATPHVLAGLDFNVSHTGGMIVCLVGQHLEFGVDVEDRQRARRTVDIAERFFSPREARALRSLPDHAQGDRFMELWTLKEAYIKARGMGLRIPLAHFSFELSAGPDAIAIAFEPELQDDASSWRFSLSRPSQRHQLAWAVRVKGGDALFVKERDALALLCD
ncbi:MAG: 4'-phosphopantetheinyl transferase superfamily protein [Deltaproteobacteria bacterium]|nr:4'-phosphopantetheinyl transferase superfamily protein [Deltaproteobacteria bacterium]